VLRKKGEREWWIREVEREKKGKEWKEGEREGDRGEEGREREKKRA